MKNLLLRKIVREIIVERIQLIQEGKKKFFLKLVNDKKMSQDDFNIMFKPNGDFKYPFNDIHFRYVLFNTIDQGENHSFDDILEMYEIFRQKIFEPYNKSDLKDVRIPGSSFATYPINEIIAERKGTYDSLNRYIEILNSLNARTDVLQKILDEGFQGNKEHFEVIYQGDDWIVVYPRTYLGSIATARMGPDKKYYTPPTVIGILSWCTSVDSAGNAFLNYHRRLNLHMYYFTKISGFSPTDKNKKLCVSIAKKHNNISVTKGSSTVNGKNSGILENEIKSIIGENLLDIIKSDASNPSRPEIDEASYYRSISIEIYRDMRKANEENMDLFKREVSSLSSYTQNLEIVKDIIQDSNKDLLASLIDGYKGQSEEITRFLYENEDYILEKNPNLKNVGIFEFNKRYALNITVEKFINDLPELKDENSLKFYGHERWLPSPGMMESLFQYNRDYEIANTIIRDDVKYLKMFLAYANYPSYIRDNIPYQKAIQDNVEYILDNVPSFAVMKIQGVSIPFSIGFKKLKNNKRSLIPFVISLMMTRLKPEEIDSTKQNIEKIVNNVINQKDVMSASAIAFSLELCKGDDSSLLDYFSKFKTDLRRITIVRSEEENTKNVKDLVKRKKLKDAYMYMKSLQDLFNEVCNNFQSFKNVIKQNERKHYDETPMFANVETEILEKIYRSVIVIPLESGIDFLKSKEDDLSFTRSNEKYPKIVTFNDFYKFLLKDRIDTPKYDASTPLYDFGYIYFDTDSLGSKDDVLKYIQDDLIKNGYAIVSKPYFEEESSHDVVFPFGEESHLFNPDEAFIIKHYGDIFI